MTPTSIWLRSKDERFDCALDRLPKDDRIRFENMLRDFDAIADGHEPVIAALCGLVIAEKALLEMPAGSPLDQVQMRWLKSAAVEVAEYMSFARSKVLAR